MELKASLRNKISTAIVLVILFLGLAMSFAIKYILTGALLEGQNIAVDNILGAVITVTVIAIILSIFIGFGLANLITKPVNRLRAATEKMSNGDLGVQVGIETGDEIEELALSFNNMTARLKEVYDNLLKANQELEKANRVKSEFLGTMSHELRTPLAAVIGFSELVAEGALGGLNEEQADAMREVLSNGAELLNMITSLLDFTKIESGTLSLQKEPLDLGMSLQTAFNTIAPLARKKGLKIEMEIAGELPLITGDSKKIQQSVLNLLSNAVKFTPKDGEISLKVRRIKDPGEFSSRSPYIDVIKEHEGEWIEIAVRDSGIGIPGEQIERVFDMFYQVDGTKTREYGGVGLGLAIAQQLILMHGGYIWAESELNKGSIFTIVLPVPMGRL